MTVDDDPIKSTPKSEVLLRVPVRWGVCLGVDIR